MNAAEERTGEVFPLAAFLFLGENRVWGFDGDNQKGFRTAAALSSTARLGCGYVCDGTASELTYGRFNSPDPYQASAGPNDPGSWNRYAYVQGDPVNYTDSRGLERDGVDLLECLSNTWGSDSCFDDGGHKGTSGKVPPAFAPPGEPPGTFAGGRGELGSVAKKDIRDAIDKILGDGTNCQKDVTNQFGTDPGHGSISSLRDHVDGITIFDTSQPGVGQMTIASALGSAAGTVPGQNVTLGTWVSSNIAGVPYLGYSDAGHYQLSTAIVLSGSFYGRNLVIQQADLVHEILHVYTGRNDGDLAAALGLSYGDGEGAASLAIRNYLRSDCTVKAFK